MSTKRVIPEVPCQIKELNLSCYGCCGRDFLDEKSVEKDLKLNTEIFSTFNNRPIRFELMKFRDRLSENPDDVLPSGLCSNVVDFGGGCVGCPLHPVINKIVSSEKYKYPFNKKHQLSQKRDPRFNYCDVNYECATFKYFKHFSDDQKLKFVEWVKEKKYSRYQYSMENGDNILIQKFMKDMGWVL